LIFVHFALNPASIDLGPSGGVQTKEVHWWDSGTPARRLTLNQM
jgi:hypothetical protein